MKIRCMLLLLVVLCLSAALGEDAPRPVRLMVASDLHYLAPELYEGSELFVQSIAKGDGKATMYSGELLSALIAEVRHQRPDLLILSGDLTFNGEQLSHQQLADALRVLTAEGIAVAVIPGNHDINSRTPVKYLPQGYVYVDGVDGAAFRSIWQGMTAAELTGPGSCGVVRVTDRVWVAMGDYSVYETKLATYGEATPAHTEWMRQVTDAAMQAGAVLITVSHQALVQHTSYAADAYIVWNTEEIMDRMKAAGCCLNLSGHMHLQHLADNGWLTDIATASWSMAPHRYALVTVEADGSVHYRAQAVCGEHLPDGLAAETRAFFRRVTADKQRPQLAKLGLDEASIEAMVTFATDVNEAYFNGTLPQRGDLSEDHALALWQQASSAGFGAYMLNLLSEPQPDPLSWDGPKRAALPAKN